MKLLAITSLLWMPLCAGARAQGRAVDLSAEAMASIKNYHARCSLSDLEIKRAEDYWDWTTWNSFSTWDAIQIHYNYEPPKGEIARCIAEITESKTTQRHLRGFVDAVHRVGFKRFYA